MQNASFAKFLTNRTSFGASGELSFFIRTREHNGLVVFMTDSGDDHIAVVVHEGFLTIQVKSDGVNSNVTLNESINDGEWHFAEMQGNMLRLDNHTQEVVLTGGKSINLTFTFIGGLDDYNRFPDAFLIRNPFRGCLQDIRLNNQLLDFGFTSPSVISMDQYQLLASSHLGEGCKGMDVCRSAPCGVGGYCKDLWNKYQCDCKPRYGGTDCALYGCALVNLCPANTTCRDVGENYECRWSTILYIYSFILEVFLHKFCANNITPSRRGLRFIIRVTGPIFCTKRLSITSHVFWIDIPSGS